jgi:dUTPase
LIKFEFVEKYKDCGLDLPVRKTQYSAGYDFQVAEDTLIPPYSTLFDEMYADCMSRGVIFRNERGWDEANPQTLEEVAAMTKAADTKPTLVPTGVKCHLDPDTYL